VVDTLKELKKFNTIKDFKMSSEGKYLNSSYQNFFEKSLSETDPELFKSIQDELKRQQ